MSDPRTLRPGERQVFVDDRRVAARQGLDRHVHPARKLEKPVLRAELQHEMGGEHARGTARRVYLYGAVLRDGATGHFRMWYNSVQEFLYTESEDGLQWTRPNLRSCTDPANPDNRLPVIFHSPSVIVDASEPDPSRRYKAVGFRGGWGNGNVIEKFHQRFRHAAQFPTRAYWSAFSSDGLDWQYYDEAIIPGSDTICLAQDPQDGTYLAFHKLHNSPETAPVVRQIYLSTSRNFVDWTDSEIVLLPDEIDHAAARKLPRGTHAEFYNMAAFPYGGQWLGLVTVFYRTGAPLTKGPEQSDAEGPIHVQLTHSRDGRRWERASDRSPVIALGPHAYDAGAILGTASAPVIVGEEMWVYYTAVTTTHGGSAPEKELSIALAKWRLDGMISMRATDLEGTLTTTLLQTDGEELYVNADLSNGRLLVELRDSAGKTVPGYSKADSIPLQNDASVCQRVRWRATGTLPAGLAVLLVFYIVKGNLFSYHVESRRNPHMTIPLRSTAPRVIGRPPSDAYIGLSLLPDGEIRHYDYGQQRVGEQEGLDGGRSREATGWIASLDDGETWTWHDAPRGFVGADVQSPVSGEWMRLLAAKDGIDCVRSQGGLDGSWTRTRVVDRLGIMLKPPIFIRGGKRVVVAGHPPRGHSPFNGGRRNDPQQGCGVLLSDDDGLTWRWSQLVTTPDHQPGGFHQGARWNHGAAEPTVIELRDGRLWMLIRTSQDFHYQSFSHDGGETWEPARPSRFYGTITQPTLGRLRDGLLLLIWNNTTPLPEVEGAHGVGEDVFTNRDAVHAAVSDDDGKTWRGFRELALIEKRHDPDYAETGGIDRSLQQSQFVQTQSGRVIVAVGQHPLHRILLAFDPDWLLETERDAVFDSTLSQFSAQTFIRGIRGHCAFNRKAAATMVTHPDDPARLCLRVKRTTDPQLIDERGGFVWNFPASYSGVLTLRVRLLPGFEGARITLTDRWFNPIDPIVHQISPISLEIGPDGTLQSGQRLPEDQWSTLHLRWTHCDHWPNTGGAAVQVNEKRYALLARTPAVVNGLSYLHVASTAGREDSGLLIDLIRTEGMDNDAN